MPSRERPIFVVGYQRSGTTLLQSLLGAHPRIAAPPETHFILRVAYFDDLFGDLSDDGNLRRALREAINAPLGILDECGFDEETLFEKARHGERTYAGLFSTLMDDYAERNGKVRWSDKTPSQRPDDIFSLFPDALIVHIMRDPRDVVASSLAAPWDKRSAVTIARDLAAFTLESIERGRRAGSAHYLQLRHEDLTRDPEATLRLVCAFVGEDYDPVMLDPSRRGAAVMRGANWQEGARQEIRPAVSNWREKLGYADRVRVQAYTRELLGPFGYPPPSAAVRALTPLARAETTLRYAIPRAFERQRRPKTPEKRYRAVQALMNSAVRNVQVLDE
jgi:hypothetical protein